MPISLAQVFTQGSFILILIHVPFIPAPLLLTLKEEKAVESLLRCPHSLPTIIEVSLIQQQHNAEKEELAALC